MRKYSLKSGLFFVAFFASLASANEGMWTFHGPPSAAIQRAYGFAPTQNWLDHVRLSSVRIENFGTGSFVSSNGLLLTNHHVALDALQKLSESGKKDYVKDGFYARAPEQEVKLKDTEVRVLVAMEDVTARVRAAAQGATEAEVNEKRKAEMAAIEKEASGAAGTAAEVVTLYEGGEYWLYRYKTFSDVRLVMAPEHQAAFYGGDLDNFTYPRHDLDFAFFRVYEDGKPYEPQHYLKWSKTGPVDGEPVFVSGNPGVTQRLKTLAQLETIKDVHLPEIFARWSEVAKVLQAYSDESPEQARQAKRELFSINNTLKVRTGQIKALANPAVLERKAKEEAQLRAAVDKDLDLAEAKGAFDRVAQAAKDDAAGYVEKTYAQLVGGDLTYMANTIVRLAEETMKPNGERWKEYRDSALDSLKHELLADNPFYLEMEKRLLALRLELSRRALGDGHAFIQDALGGRAPKDVAEEVLSKTRLHDAAYRKELVEGGMAAVLRSDDPLIRLAIGLSPYYRLHRTLYEDLVEAVEIAASALIAKARFAVLGKSIHPDANFTLRLSYGRVAGYEEGTTKVPPFTTFYGLYDRAAGFNNKPPFDLPAQVDAARNRVNLATPLNFVTTNDITGGNSGSPVVNQNGELVGLIFDGNIHSLAETYFYSDEQARALAVHSAGILEALVNIYGGTDLVAELTRDMVQAFSAEGQATRPS